MSVQVQTRDEFAQTLTITAGDNKTKQAIGMSTASRLLVTPNE
jgi:hypothetical protein